MDIVTAQRHGVVGTCRLEIILKSGGDPVYSWENDCAIVHDTGAVELKPGEFSAVGKFEAKSIILQIRTNGGWDTAQQVDITRQIVSLLH